MAAERKVQIATNFEDAAPADDLSVDAQLVADLKGTARAAGYLIGDWSIKENKNGRTIAFTCSRVPWEQAVMPFEKDDSEAAE